MSASTGTYSPAVRFREDLEIIRPDEAETFQSLRKVFESGENYSFKRHGCPMRGAHAKAFGVLKGEVVVDDDLSPELRQGLFAHAAKYPVVARLSHAPFEPTDDRGLSSVHGLAVKVMGVEGAKLGDHAGQSTQDFLCVTGKVFLTRDAKGFLRFMVPTEASQIATPGPVMNAVSAVARGAHAALHAVGVPESAMAKLDFMGHPRKHPLSESYFTQMVIRYGDYVAKVGLFPSAELVALGEHRFEIDGKDGIRAAVGAHIAAKGAEYEVRVQLCRDVESMPVEDISVEWPEAVSPYTRVGRLVFPPQDAYSDARAAFVETRLSFTPAHCLQAHRPLGSIGRARIYVYRELSKLRAEQAGVTLVEPRGAEEIPD